MIDIGVGEEHSRNRRAAWLQRMERRERFDLRGDVRRAVEQEPPLSVDAERKARLCAPGR